MENVYTKDEMVQTSSKISWGAILAGATVSVGLWVLFHVIGLAAGLTAIDPNSPGSLRAAGIGTGVWSIIATLISLFAGGVMVAYVTTSLDRVSGALHGTVLWAFTIVAGMGLVAGTASMLMSNTARLGGAAVSAAGGLTNLANNADPLQALGLEAKDFLVPLNQHLNDQGKPSITPDQLQAAMRESVQNAVRQGRFDRNILAAALARNTPLTRSDVEDLAYQVEQRVGVFGERIDRMQTAALQAAESTGKGLWWVFGMLLFGLVASAGGAVLGVGLKKRHFVEQDGEVVRRIPIGTPAHVST